MEHDVPFGLVLQIPEVLVNLEQNPRYEFWALVAEHVALEVIGLNKSKCLVSVTMAQNHSNETRSKNSLEKSILFANYLKAYGNHLRKDLGQIQSNRLNFHPPFLPWPTSRTHPLPGTP